jgi:hypothetical protein
VVSIIKTKEIHWNKLLFNTNRKMEYKRTPENDTYRYDLEENESNNYVLALLYRNEVEYSEYFDDGKLKYEATLKYGPHKCSENSVYMTEPIAKGVTAFFGHDSIDSLKNAMYYSNFESEKEYDKYLDWATTSEYLKNKRQPSPKLEQEAKIEILSEHIKQEREHLKASELFYSESRSDKELYAKPLIKKYAEAYIKWVGNKLEEAISKQEETEKPQKIYPEHFYGVAYKILQGVKVENQFIDSDDRKAIIQFGVDKYKLKTKGRDFYNGWKEFDLLNTASYIKSYPRYRRKWKVIILDITKNNNDVALWLKRQND